ncbi:MAG: hypothetical protein HRT44_03380 [Bdellovibrionales bacterium]|nr:hypothetical protein [Bdellovibrionales bacterium]
MVVDKSHYVRKNKEWTLVKRYQETLEYEPRETTTPGDVIQGQPVPATPQGQTQTTTDREFDESEPLVFRIDNSCQGEDRRIFTRVTHHFFRNLLPCMHRFHPALAWELANNIRRHRTQIRCNQTQREGIVAYTTTRRSEPIYWGTFASPSAIARNGRRLGIRNAGEAMGFLANSLMHEALHNLGIVHRDPIDPAYGCEVLCNEAQHTVPFSFRMGCRSCLGTRVAGQPSSVSQNICNR